MYSVHYFDEVEKDIAEAKKWYAEQQDGLDVRFVTAVKAAITNIVKIPLAYAIRYRNVRIAHTKIFPYNVHFYVDESKAQVVITGIIHNKRNDALFLNR
jgi:mRNA-degrading endonuclease RelE of RelBE toxin-antitoxin system